MVNVVRGLLPRSLMWRALMIVVTPLIVMQVLATYVFYESHWDQVSKQLAQGVAGDIALLVDAVERIDDAEGGQWLVEAAARDMDLQITFEPGAILPNSAIRQTAYGGELRRALRRKNLARPFLVESIAGSEQVTVSVQLAGGVLKVVTPRTRLISWTTYLFILWLVGTSLILLGFAAMFMRNQVRPVRRLARVADAFGKGRDVPDFKPEGAREVRLAGLAFIAMRNRIQRQISQRTAMLAGVSHDLRTPLTRMKLQLEMMPPGDGVRALQEDVADMERMLDGYLAFARGEGTEKPKDCDFNLLLEEAVRQAKRKGGVVTLTIDGKLALPVRPNAMQRCLTNLLDNALRFASHVAVRAANPSGTIEVTIDDNGPGIPPKQREAVFKPFYRIESSRNPLTGGVGLGLSIARDVARSHGGDIVLEDSPLGGLRVRLRLPV
jgi:two-component system osmolarity sensor histidine kinase EnvZ